MRMLIGALLWLAMATCAVAQGCGPQNPNCIVPTAPPGTSNNQAASTAFVQTAVGGGGGGGSLTVGTTPITGGSTGLCLYVNGAVLGNQPCASGGGGSAPSVTVSTDPATANSISPSPCTSSSGSCVINMNGGIAVTAPITGTCANGSLVYSASGSVGCEANLPVANLNGGVGATSGTFWRGDGSWAPPAGVGSGLTVGAPIIGTCPNGSLVFSNATNVGCEQNITTANLASGVGATAASFFRGDGIWAVPGGVGCTFTGLVITNNAAKQVTVSWAGATLNVPVTFAQVRTAAQSFVIDLSTTGVNGMDTGATGNNNFVYLWAIYNGATYAGLGSLSSTAPALPGGYTYSCYMGAMKTGPAGNLFASRQVGIRARYIVSTGVNLPVVSSGITGSTCAGAAVYTAFGVRDNSGTGVWVPATASQAVFHVEQSLAGIVSIAPNPAYTTATTFYYQVSGPNFAGPVDMALESNNVYVCSTTAAGIVHVAGWNDTVLAP